VAISTLVGQSLGARRPELAEASLTLMGAVGVAFALFGRSNPARRG
jgi:Na+-driven multidrug efflux pump